MGKLPRLYQVWKRAKVPATGGEGPAREGPLFLTQTQPKTLLFEPVTFHGIFSKIKSSTIKMFPGTPTMTALLALLCSGCGHASLATVVSGWNGKTIPPFVLYCHASRLCFQQLGHD